MVGVGHAVDNFGEFVYVGPSSLGSASMSNGQRRVCMSYVVLAVAATSSLTPDIMSPH